MKTIITLLFVAITSALLEPEIEDWPHKDQGVIELTDDNFDETMERASVGILVEFTAPYCEACIRVEREFNRAAKVLGKKKSLAVIAKIDVTAHRKIA